MTNVARLNAGRFSFERSEETGTIVDADTAAILAWVDAQRATMLDSVVRWASINSGTGNLVGLAHVAEVLRLAFGPLGGTIAEETLGPVTSIDASGRETPMELGKALRIVKRPEAPRRVFLCIHMDTVYPADHPFQTVTRADENTLRGPGVADAKGGLCVMLTA